MIHPKRAPVRPRVILPETEDTVPLETIFLEEAPPTGAVELIGDRGSGKSTSLAHLAALAPPDRRVFFFDEDGIDVVAQAAQTGLAVYTSFHPRPVAGKASYFLAPWGEDELVEYLLAEHPARCGSVMARLHVAPDRDLPAGIPELWRVVLDRMAEDESLPTVCDALRREVVGGLTGLVSRTYAEEFCLAATARLWKQAEESHQELRASGVNARLLRLLRHEPVQLILAADHLAALLESGGGEAWLSRRLPRELIVATAAAISSQAADRLLGWMPRWPQACEPMVASLLHRANRSWMPSSPPPSLLSGAYLDGVVWQDLDLRGVKLKGADLRGATFHLGSSRSGLVGSPIAGEGSRTGFYTDDFDQQIYHPPEEIRKANLRGADLRGARIENTDFYLVDLRGARYTEEQFTHFRRCGAILFDRA